MCQPFQVGTLFVMKILKKSKVNLQLCLKKEI